MNFFSLRNVTDHSCSFCYTESESDGQISLSHQDFEKIEVKCAKKVILAIFAIMA